MPRLILNIKSKCSADLYTYLFPAIFILHKLTNKVQRKNEKVVRIARRIRQNIIMNKKTMEIFLLSKVELVKNPLYIN